jgi:hypothetical protein
MLLLCLFTNVLADTDPNKNMDSLRREYVEAVESDTKTDALLKKLTQQHIKDPLLIAYRGGAEALKAKHAFNPYTKINYLKKSQKSLEQAVAMRPEDIEIRFLRFSIQHYLPGFLRQSKELEEDRLVIVTHISDVGLDKTMQQSIGKFLIDSGRCTTAEIQQIRKALH